MLTAPARWPNPRANGATIRRGAAATSRAAWMLIGIALERLIAKTRVRTYVRFVCEGDHSQLCHRAPAHARPPLYGSARATSSCRHPARRARPGALAHRGGGERAGGAGASREGRLDPGEAPRAAARERGAAGRGGAAVRLPPPHQGGQIAPW